MTADLIGILIGTKTYGQFGTTGPKSETVSFYEEAGLVHGLKPCFFRLQDLAKGTDTLRAYVLGSKGYRKTTVRIPSVIHNRAIFSNGNSNRLLERIAAERGIQVFNGQNRYDKMLIHQLLMLGPQIRPHLPETAVGSVDLLAQMMACYDSLIVKPANGSVGHGIMKLERRVTGWLLEYPERSTGKRVIRKRQFHKPPALLISRLNRQRYLIQQRLPLATSHGKPFDLRVSVQRDQTGLWQVTGIAAKVAWKGHFLTNVAQGAHVLPLEGVLAEYPHLAPERVRQDITVFALQVAEHLCLFLPNLADLGLDIGLTTEGFPMFIECNGRDQRYCFRDAGMVDEWKATYGNPIGYGRYLLDQMMLKAQAADFFV